MQTPVSPQPCTPCWAIQTEPSAHFRSSLKTSGTPTAPALGAQMDGSGVEPPLTTTLTSCLDFVHCNVSNRPRHAWNSHHDNKVVGARPHIEYVSPIFSRLLAQSIPLKPLTDSIAPILPWRKRTIAAEDHCLFLGIGRKIRQYPHCPNISCMK